MEDARFDGLARALGRGTSRRGVLGLPASLAVLGVGLGILAPEETEGRKGRKGRKRHKQGKENHPDRRNDHVTDEKKKKKKKKKPQPPPACTPDAKGTTCAARCGSITNNCGQAVDCGSCACVPACKDCSICDESTRTCVVDPGQEGKACGSIGQICQAGGVCACDVTSCPTCQQCGGDGTCSGCPGCCDGSGVCQDGNTNAVCGATGEVCTVCSGQEACVDGACVCQPTTCTGTSCGQISNGCGGTLQCGGCSNPTPICSNNVCTACGSNDDCFAGQRCCAGSCLSHWTDQSTFGSFGTGPGQFSGPWGLTLSANKLTMWVTDSGNSRVSVWTRSNVNSAWTFQTTFGQLGTGNGQLTNPWGVAVSADTLTAWVADTDNHRVSIWTRPSASSTAWTYQEKFGTAATGLGTFGYPSGITLSDDELTLWVLDSARGFSVWTRPFVGDNRAWTNPKMFGARGSGASEFLNPYGMAVSADQLTMWIADSGNHRISVWTRPSGTSTNWTHETNFGGPDQLNTPTDVAVSNDSRMVWVTEAKNNRFSVWTRPNANSNDWSSLTTFGSAGSGASGFNYPTEISGSGDNAALWMADSGNNRISIWALTCPA